MSDLWLGLCLILLLQITGSAAMPNGWYSSREFQWYPSGTMDAIILGQNSSVLAPLNYSQTTGNAELPVLRSSDFASPQQSLHVGLFSCQLASNYSQLASDLTNAIKAPNLQTAAAFPNLKLFHALDNGTHVCVGIYAKTNGTDPCQLKADGSFLNTTATTSRYIYTPLPGSAFGYTIVAEIVEYYPTSYYYWHFYVNSVRYVTFVHLVFFADKEYASSMNNHSCMIFVGGPSLFTVHRMEKQGKSFVCEEWNNSAILEYCVAPNMHLCTDLHHRAHCRTLPCVHGTYNYYTGNCDCYRNYAGPLCKSTPCIPFCVGGDCLITSNSCRCDSGYGGERCEILLGNETSTPVNVTVPPDTEILVDINDTIGNQSFVHIPGTLIVMNGSRLMVRLTSVPVNGQQLIILQYGRIIGMFAGIDFVVNGSELESCMGYSADYSPTELSVLFTDNCDRGFASWKTMLICFSIIGSLVVVCILLARYNPTFRRFIFPFHHMAKRPYGRLESSKSINLEKHDYSELPTIQHDPPAPPKKMEASIIDPLPNITIVSETHVPDLKISKFRKVGDVLVIDESSDTEREQKKIVTEIVDEITSDMRYPLPEKQAKDAKDVKIVKDV